MKFSVIICSYNAAHFLPQALECVAAQTFPDFEVLIIDDASTDSTAHIAQAFAPRLMNYRYLAKSHTGIAKSRTFGVQHARGTHIAYIDADDFWSPRYLEEVAHAFTRPSQPELVCFDAWRISHSGNIIGPLLRPRDATRDGLIEGKRSQVDLALQTRSTTVSFVRSLFDRVGEYESRRNLGEDQQWIIRAVAQGVRFTRRDQKLALYRQHDASLTSQSDVAYAAYLEIIADLVGRGVLDRHTIGPARELAWKWLSGLMTCMPRSRSLELARSTRRLFGTGPAILGCEVLLELHLHHLLRAGRDVRQFVRGSTQQARNLDLKLRPEALFDSIEQV